MAVPTYAIWRGQRVRILYYFRNGLFMVLDRTDNRRLVPRGQLTFLPS